MIDHKALMEYLPFLLTITAIIALIYAFVQLHINKKATGSKIEHDDTDDDEDFFIFDDDEDDDKKKDKPEIDITHAKSCLYNGILTVFDDLKFDVETIAGYSNFSDDRVGVNICVAVLANDVIYLDIDIVNDQERNFRYSRFTCSQYYVRLDHANHQAEVISDRTYYSESDSRKDTVRLATLMFEICSLCSVVPDFKI